MSAWTQHVLSSDSNPFPRGVVKETGRQSLEFAEVCAGDINVEVVIEQHVEAVGQDHQGSG